MTATAEHLSKAADETVKRVKAGTHEAIEKAADISRQAADTLCEKGEQIKHLEEQFLENCRNYVHDKPVTSLAIAVGLGILLSPAQFALVRGTRISQTASSACPMAPMMRAGRLVGAAGSVPHRAPVTVISHMLSTRTRSMPGGKGLHL